MVFMEVLSIWKTTERGTQHCKRLGSS